LECPTTTLCVATDVASTSSADYIITSTNPTGGAAAWQAVNVPLSDLACPSAGLCIGPAPFNHIRTSTNPTGGAGAWPSTAFLLDAGAETAIACASAGLCIDFDSREAAVSDNPAAGGSSWTRANVEVAGVRITDLSCPTVAFCVAVAGGSYVRTVEISAEEGGGGSEEEGGSSGGGASPAPITSPIPEPQPHKKPLKCRKGFKKREAHGKAKCVKVKKHRQ
jgi:hypothetical protein